MSRVSGILTIIFGLILLVFPWFGLWTLSAILGFILVLIGVGLLIFGAFTYGSSKGAAVAFLILGVLGLSAGVGMFGNVGAFAALAGFALYLSAGILIVSGLVHVFRPITRFSRGIGVVGIVLGGSLHHTRFISYGSSRSFSLDGCLAGYSRCNVSIMTRRFS